MSFQPALPPWLTKAVEDAGDATVILKPGDRPFVIKSKAPYHLGTQPMTNLTMEGLAQQILSEDAQQSLSKGENVEETLQGDKLSVSVNAVRLDHDIVIKLRNAATKEPEVDEVAQHIEEETRIIKAETAQALRDAAATAHQASLSPSAEASPTAPRPAFVVQNAGGEPVADIELPVEEDAVDTFIAKLSPAAASTANAAVETVFDESASQPAGRTSAFARLSKFFSSSAAASEREEAARRVHEEEAARLAKEDAARRAQEEAARRAKGNAARRSGSDPLTEIRKQEEAARRAQEEAARRAQEDAARREQEEAARRAQEEAARHAQEDAARREQEDAARHAQEDAARREQEEAARRAQEDAARREQEEAARRAQEDAARREQEEAARRAQEDAARRAQEDAARREQEDAARHAQEDAARREQEEAARRAQEDAARREQEEVARRAQEDAARREQEDAARHAQEDAARREQEEAARRAQEDAARREQEDAARREQEDAARREQEEAARHAQEDAARREQEEAARRAQEDAARREQEEAARRAQEDAARREQEEAARHAQEDAARREQEEAARRAQEDAARREQEEAARRAQEDAARREQEEAARRAQEDAARREQEEAARRAQEDAARREQEEAARREQEEATRRDLEERARRAQDEAEAARREHEEAARRAREEVARREQDEAARRDLEQMARRAQDEAEAARRELAEVTRRAQEDAARLALEEVARREQEAADRRAQEEAARREQDEAARRDLEERARRAHDEAEAARRELAEVTRRAQADAARRDHEEAARRQQEEAARREQEEAAQRELEQVARRIKEEAARLALTDAARQRLQTAEESDIPAETEPPPARATVVELNRRGPLAAATTELTDWILDAMDQGATALYLRAGKAPFARIDGQVEILAVEPIPLSMFERAGAMMSAGEDGWEPAGEWAWSKHIPGTGSVHCQAFSDGQGGGFIVQLPVSVTGLDEQVPRHIRNACETGEGLIVVSAPFAEDVAAMVGAVVAWSAHRRAGHIVSFGTNGSLERVAGNAFISDRPLPAGDHGMTTAVHAALRERPDMLVVIASGPLPAVHALVSAAVGRLVIVGVVARTAPRALEVLLNELGPNRHLLAATFKAGCSWRGFRTAVERRLVIADTLVATDRVSALIEAGDITGLHLAQTQRTDGMRSVDAALAAAVARKKITLREAAACAVDRKSLISLVRRQAQQRRAAERDEQSALQRASVLRTMNGA